MKINDLENHFDSGESGRKRKLFWLSSFVILLFSTLNVFSQLNDYTIIGRVIDDNGKPIPENYVSVAPIETYIMDRDDNFTDQNGRFSIKREAKKGDTWYLYVSHQLLGVEDAEVMGDVKPPFSGVNQKNKHFLGKPVKFGDEKVIDVGDVKVQFWFNTAYFKVQTQEGRNLTKEEWHLLWGRLIDDKGNILAEGIIGGLRAIRKNSLDLETSILKLLLPEGKWKLDFQIFDHSKTKVIPKTIGETPYFNVAKEGKGETINVWIAESDLTTEISSKKNCFRKK